MISVSGLSERVEESEVFEGSYPFMYSYSPCYVMANVDVKGWKLKFYCSSTLREPYDVTRYLNGVDVSAVSRIAPSLIRSLMGLE